MRRFDCRFSVVSLEDIFFFYFQKSERVQTSGLKFLSNEFSGYALLLFLVSKRGEEI